MIKPMVGIIMGSNSDLSLMKEAGEFLDHFNIPYEMTIVSAHRTPNRLYSYAKEAKERGIKLIIAGAGDAAHLPGMVAALTAVPVIGVPINSGTLNGMDALYSIVQMPEGTPVATVAINGAKNAGILAAQLLGMTNETIYQNILAYKKATEESELEKAVSMERILDKNALQFTEQYS